MDSYSEIQEYNVYPMLHFRRTFSSGVTADRTYGLLLKAATLDEATPSSVQCGEPYSSPRQPNYRPEDRGPPTTHSH